MNLNQEDLKSIFKKKISSKIIKNICINSKEAKKNSIFIAIKGKRTDGHLYVNEALKKGCDIAVVKKNFKIEKKYKNKIYKVDSPLNFLIKIAKYQRTKSNGIFIGITGSFGKTTLKFMLSYFLSKYKKTFSSPKSFNNHFGLPLSLSNTPHNSKYNIFEIGMSNKGEINKLSKILKPNISVITNIGPAHLENLKSLKNICLAKAEIMNHMKDNEVICLNANDEYFNTLKEIAKKKNLKIITFGYTKKCNVQLLKTKKELNKLYLLIKIYKTIYKIETNSFNKNFIDNFLITCAISFHLGINLEKIVKSAKKFPTPSGRGNIVIKKFNNNKIKIIDESYNANPVSMKNAIENFSYLITKKRKKIAIIGDMLELGSHSKFYHEQLAGIIKNSNIDHFYFVGKEVLNTYRKLKNTDKYSICEDVLQFKEVFFEILNEKSIFLIKGSNGVGLHKLLNKF